MGILFQGPVKWSSSRDKDGFTDYKVTYLVQAGLGEGPSFILNFTPGLPFYGTPWIVPTFNPDATFPFDLDIWAWFRWDAEVQPVVDDEIPDLYHVTMTASNRWPSPRDGDRPYAGQPPSDPRLDPPKITGSFVRYTEEAVQDRFGNYITNSAWQLLRGPHVEFDRNRPQIKIEFNSPNLPLTYLTAMTDTVNAYPLWGLPPRTIKLSEANWELKFEGQGNYYYGINLVFDINFGSWDRDILDEGTKVLHGEWDSKPGGTGNWIITPINSQIPNPLNPQHFIRFKDRNGENSTVVLDGNGLPAGVYIGTAQQQTVSNGYMCIIPNRGSAPSLNLSLWTPVLLPLANKATEFTLGVYYPAGTVVTFAGVTYLAIQDGSNIAPNTSLDVWLPVAAGTIPKDVGNWYAPRSYEIGECVHATPVVVDTGIMSGPHPPGTVHVEKYSQSDFALLGIPLTFPQAF